VLSDFVPHKTASAAIPLMTNHHNSIPEITFHHERVNLAHHHAHGDDMHKNHERSTFYRVVLKLPMTACLHTNYPHPLERVMDNAEGQMTDEGH
jgi:hypothetical protein